MLRLVAARKKEELTELRGDLALASERNERQCSDGAGLGEQLTELEARYAEAAELDIVEDADAGVYALMASRLSKRRPHLLRKLAYMRSSLIEMGARLATAESEGDVAEAARTIAVDGLAAEKARGKLRAADMAAQREEMLEQVPCVRSTHVHDARPRACMVMCTASRAWRVRVPSAMLSSR